MKDPQKFRKEKGRNSSYQVAELLDTTRIRRVKARKPRVVTQFFIRGSKSKFVSLNKPKLSRNGRKKRGK